MIFTIVLVNENLFFILEDETERSNSRDFEWCISVNLEGSMRHSSESLNLGDFSLILHKMFISCR